MPNMASRVDGRVAFVTGAARGQGRAYAARLAEEGAAGIIAVDICADVPGAHLQYPGATREDLEETVGLVEAVGGRIVAEVVDVRDLDALTRAADRGASEFGKIDIVVANAGVCVVAPWDQLTPESLRATIDVNLIGAWNTVRATLPHLIRNGGGSVILVSSAAGLKGLPFLAAYTASKHGVTGLARSLAIELGQQNIRVNSLHPGAVATPMDGVAAAFGPLLEANPAVGGSLQSALPSALSEPEDQANAMLFLASDESKFVTGHALAVDAGNSQF
jgi:SDR family mycofactocin-dependent oxidoreductase